MVHVLALQLRSVFVPYYRYVIDGAFAHLTGSASEAQPQPKKKRKKSSLTPADGAPAPVDEGAGLRWLVRHRVNDFSPSIVSSAILLKSAVSAADESIPWHCSQHEALAACHQPAFLGLKGGDTDVLGQFCKLCPLLQVLRALQACFQFDSGAFMTPELFKRLLPSLVAQLRGGPPAEAQASLAAYAAPGEPDSAGSDVYGETAVATLVELAASTGNDELWKPFNHQVLLSPSLCEQWTLSLSDAML